MTDITYAEHRRHYLLSRYGSLLLLLLLLGSAIFYFKPDPDAPNQDNTLTVGGPWEFSSVDPSKHGYIFSRMQVVETLLNVNSRGQLTRGLAVEMAIAPDGLQWQFRLRPDVTFHDGTPMTVDAVINSLNQTLSKHGVLRRAPIVEIHKINEAVLAIDLETPYTALGALLANYASVILAPASYGEQGEVKHLYGTGAYQLFEFAPPHKFTVKANDSYWGDQPQIMYANYLTGHRAESRMLQAKSGQVDLVFSLDPAMLSQLEGVDYVTLHQNEVPRSLMVKLNNQHKFLKDKAARQALNLALDRQGIARNVLYAPGSETGQLLPQSMGDWHLPNTPAPTQDLDKAKQLLIELGWVQGADGILVREGERFELTLMTYADRPELAAVATAIQAQWRLLGVELNVDVTNSSMIPAGHTDGSLEVALIARNLGTIADPLPLLTGDYAYGGGDWGAMGWQRPDVDDAFAILNSISDVEARRGLPQFIAQAIYEDLPVLAIANYSQHTAVNARVQGFRFDPYERSYFLNEMIFGDLEAYREYMQSIPPEYASPADYGGHSHHNHAHGYPEEYNGPGYEEKE